MSRVIESCLEKDIRRAGSRRAWVLHRLFYLVPVLIVAGLVSWRSVVVLTSALPAFPKATPLFEDSSGSFLSDGQAVYDALGFWALPSPLPERVRATVIAVEDRRFDRHPGVDPIGMARALVRTLSGRLQGASTIAMQAVRLAHPRPRTLLAKLEESAAALVATLAYGRDAILERYLRLLPQGGNMYGLAYSARRCFFKPVEDLSWAECALLMAVPQDPKGRALFTREGFYSARSRARVILNQLVTQNVIDSEDYEAALYDLEAKDPITREKRPPESYHYILRVMGEFAMRPIGELNRPVRTTLNPDIQSLATRLALEAIPDYRRLGADNMALMIVDTKTGNVLAYVGSANYFDEANKGSIDYCRVPRSSGSTLKPFFYAFGLKTGAFGPSSVLADMPLRMKDSGGEYTLTDFDDSYLGPMLYRAALGNSRNVPAIRVLEGVGLEECYSRLGLLGLHDFERKADFYGYGMAVGGIYTSLDRLVEAYACLANEGRQLPLRWFADSPPSEGAALLSESSARMISLFLSDTEARLPSFAGTALTHFPFPVAVKTGTSNGFRDAWAIGYSRRFVAGIWIGHSGFLRMNRVAGSTAAELLLKLFTRLQPEAVEGVGEELFPPPRGWSAVKICPESGLLATDICPHVVLERFAPGTEPRRSCEVHKRLVVDTRTGSEAGTATPAAYTASRVVTVLGPEYAAYSLARGYGAPGLQSPDIAAASVSLISPVDGTRVIIDPEIPPRFQTLALRASVNPAVSEIVWYVDDREFARVGFPYEARWPISPGTHTIRAAFPHAFVESASVVVTVSGS